MRCAPLNVWWPRTVGTRPTLAPLARVLLTRALVYQLVPAVRSTSGIHGIDSLEGVPKERTVRASGSRRRARF
jgi:hypothetical protein